MSSGLHWEYSLDCGLLGSTQRCALAAGHDHVGEARCLHIQVDYSSQTLVSTENSMRSDKFEDCNLKNFIIQQMHKYIIRRYN